MVTALDTVDNDFETEQPTEVINFDPAKAAAAWLEQLAEVRVNLRPRLAVDPQAVTQQMAVQS